MTSFSKPLINFTLTGLGLLGTLQLAAGAIYLLAFIGGGSDTMNLVYSLAGISGGVMFYLFYFVLKFIKAYLEKNNYEMEDQF